MTTYPNVQDKRLQNPTSLPWYCFAQACLPRGGTWAKKVAVDHGCLGYVICRGWHFLPRDMGIIASDYKDPYWTTSMIWKVRVRVIFFRGSLAAVRFWEWCLSQFQNLTPESCLRHLVKWNLGFFLVTYQLFTHRVPSGETCKGLKIESFSIIFNR